MSVLLRKEIRLLLPSFVIALPLALSIWLVPAHNTGPFSSIIESLNLLPFLFCPAMVIMLALDSFGREISSGTFSHLLAQPVSRAHLWLTKTLLLALALAILLTVWLLSLFLHSPLRAWTEGTTNMILVSGLFVAVAFSGGLWTVLLFRQVAAAFWFTVLIPAALLVAITNVLDDHPEKIKTTAIVVFSLYSVGGFLWAWRLFHRAQDVAWSGGAVTLPSFRTAPRPFAAREGKRRRRPRLALFAREFQLHQSQFVIAGVLAILHLGLIAARHFGHGFKSNPTLEFVANQFWFLWMVTPLLVGCASVAEERKLGTLEGQLCLPVRRRSQFFVKLFVVFVLSVLFGAAMPVLLEGSRILPELHVDYSAVLNDSPLLPRGTFLQIMVSALAALQSLPFNLPGFLFLATICVVVAAFSFYASSFARNTLQALAPATLTLLLAWLLLVGAYQIEDLLNYPLWRGALIYLIGVPVMTLTLIGLTYWNYQRVQVGWNEWRRNLLTLAATLTLVMGVTTAVYHRTWEYLSPLDPPHGAARLAPSPTPTPLRDVGGNLALLFPDGKLWTGQMSFVPSPSPHWIGQPAVFELSNNKFLEGTNWVSLALCNHDEVALRADGSLWISETFGSPWQPKPVQFEQFGGDHDWKMAAYFFNSVLLLKTDGTLWRWGSNHPDPDKNRWPGLRAFEPHRLGTNSNWEEIFSSNGDVYFRMKDGRVWVAPLRLTSNPSSVTLNEQKAEDIIILDSEIWIGRDRYLDRNPWRSLAWGLSRRFSRSGPEVFRVGVFEDGTFRLAAPEQPPFLLAKHIYQLGSESNWWAVAGNDEMVVALKRDGSLWKWTFPENPLTQPETASASRLGSHSDWVAITATGDGIVALARDGSLWQFQSESPVSALPSLLAASRRPQKLGNIFGDAP
jgi:ABC-type transport system involved in multi-copper enzyme maturation permease subunit